MYAVKVKCPELVRSDDENMILGKVKGFEYLYDIFENGQRIDASELRERALQKRIDKIKG